MPEVKWLTEHCDREDARSLSEYGDYDALRTTFEKSPTDVIEDMKSAGVRGRGGAGFPAGLKWSFVPQGGDKPKYLCCNADESEPGTFKDRVLMEKDPHILLEGIAICCYAVGIGTAYIYIRGEYPIAAQRLDAAIAEAKEKNLLGKNIMGKGFDCEVYVHRGAGAYICGEETGLLESLEGKRGHPRIKPPFPALVGLFDCPTVINNVETLAAATLVMRHGPEKYKSVGTEKSPGTKMFSVSGHVKKPGVYEIPLGTPIRELIYDICGGPLNEGYPIQCVIPGGSSAPPLLPDVAMDLTLDYEAIGAAGSMLGSGGMIVIDESVCLLDVLYNMTRFYADESCGQCTPCREGTSWLESMVHRIEHGEGKLEDLDLLDEAAKNMCGTTICVLSDSIAVPVQVFLKNFRHIFESHIEAKGCPHKMKTVTA